MRLITNIDYVTVVPANCENAVRTMSHALLLQKPWPDAGSFGGRSSQNVLRGFAASATNPTFDYALECDVTDYEVRDFASNLLLLRDGGEGVPIGGGFDLLFADGTAVRLSVSDPERPLAVDEFAPRGEHDELWATVDRRIAEFWTAPYMPVVQHADADLIRRARGAAA